MFLIKMFLIKKRILFFHLRVSFQTDRYWLTLNTVFVFFFYSLSMHGRYRPNLSVAHITTQLAFPNEDDCLAWLQQLNVKFVASDLSNVDCKASASVVTWALAGLRPVESWRVRIGISWWDAPWKAAPYFHSWNISTLQIIATSDTCVVVFLQPIYYLPRD